MIYLELFLAFFKVGLFSFGGAYSAIPLIRDVVLSYGWLSEEKLTYMIAVSESTPGSIMVNLATYVGSTQAGILGSFVATLGVVLPAFLIVLLIIAVLKNVIKNKYFQAVLQGLKPCVIGIILAAGLKMIVSNCIIAKEYITIDVRTLIITIILLITMFAYKKLMHKNLSPILLIIISAVVGIGVCGIV